MFTCNIIVVIWGNAIWHLAISRWDINCHVAVPLSLSGKLEKLRMCHMIDVSVIHFNRVWSQGLIYMADWWGIASSRSDVTWIVTIATNCLIVGRGWTVPSIWDRLAILMWEQGFIDLDKCLLIVHKEVKDIELVFGCEVLILYAAFSERS